MHPAKRVAVNTGFLYARMAITVFISLYATRLILNALGAEDFGLFNVVGGAIAMLTFLNNAMSTATQRFMSYAQGENDFEKQKRIFNVSLVLHLIIAILVVLLLEAAGYFLFNGILKIPADRIEVAKLIFQFMLVSTFFTIISVPYDAVINAHENMFLVAILGIIEAILKLAVAIYITQTAYDKLISFGLLMSILSIFLLILRQIYCHRKYNEVKINIRKNYSKPLFREMTGFAGWSLLGSASSMIANYGQGIVINMFFGTVVNAAQGIANQVSGQLGSFAGTMQKALNPMIVKSEGAGDRTLMLKATILGSKTSFFLLMITFIPVLIDMPYILNLWLKNVPEYATIFCRLLLIRNLIEQLYSTLSIAISAVGNIKRIQLITSVLNLLPLFISYYLFAQDYSAYVLYVVFIINSLILAGLVIYFAKVNCDLSITYFMKNVVLRSVGTLLLVLISALVPFYLLDPGIERLVIIISISSISFLFVGWMVGFTSEERQKINVLATETIAKIKLKYRN